MLRHRAIRKCLAFLFFLLPVWQYASRTGKKRRLPGWPLKGEIRPLGVCLPDLRLPWPKTAVFTWKSPGFSCLLPACLALAAAAACTSLA